MSARILVTGAASGIGRAVAERALAAGWAVVAADRDANALRESFADTRAFLLPLDVTDERSVEACFEAAENALGQTIDTVVHCAGRYEIEPTQTLGRAEWDRLLEVNATGSFLVAREAGARLVDAGRPGALVLVSSIAADHGDDHEPASHYSAGKAAINALTRQLAVEWGRHGVRVNCVSPGLIETPMLRILDDPPRAARTVHEVIPAGRLGDPDEVARACLFLAGPDASYISGIVLTVDGGLTAR